MAQKEGTLTPVRTERRPGLMRPWTGNVSSFTAPQRMADEMDRIFDDFGLGRRSAWPISGDTAGELWAPAVEVFQKNNELTIRADLPGLKRDEVTVEIVTGSAS